MELNAARSKVHFPAQLELGGYVGPLFGWSHEASREFNVVAWGPNLESATKIGSVEDSYYRVGEIYEASEFNLDGQAGNGAELRGRRGPDGLEFFVNGNLAIREPYEVDRDIHARNQGLVDSSLMREASVVICGCGSVGSHVAVELARAGVGRFHLVDPDTLSYGNLCRHQCGVRDVGKFKVDAVAELIWNFNPSATVERRKGIVEDIEKEWFDRALGPRPAIIVGCGDNRESDRYANSIAMVYERSFVSIGLWERGAAGEVFYWEPGRPGSPCYSCLFAETDMPMSARKSVNRKAYITDDPVLRDSDFEPGLSSDIGFVTGIGIKLILDLLGRGHQQLLGHLKEFTLIANTVDAGVGGPQVEIFGYPLQVTTSIKAESSISCSACRTIRNQPSGGV